MIWLTVAPLALSMSHRLPGSLDLDDQNVYFLTHEIAELLAGPSYGVDRLSVAYVPQVTGKGSSSDRRGGQPLAPEERVEEEMTENKRIA